MPSQRRISDIRAVTSRRDVAGTLSVGWRLFQASGMPEVLLQYVSRCVPAVWDHLTRRNGVNEQTPLL